MGTLNIGKIIEVSNAGYKIYASIIKNKLKKYNSNEIGEQVAGIKEDHVVMDIPLKISHQWTLGIQ
jgi:hypothetical protein